MSQFTVPQFIEHEAKIVGPLTFKQFVFIGIAAAFSLFLYFTIPFFLFVLATVFLMLLGIALAFMKSKGRPLPTILKNLVIFSVSPKLYLWKKKTGLPPKIIEKEKTMPKEVEKTVVPKVTGESRLNALSTKIETNIKEEIED